MKMNLIEKCAMLKKGTPIKNDWATMVSIDMNDINLNVTNNAIKWTKLL